MSTPQTPGVYQIYNTISGKSYVGSSVNCIFVRYRNHRRQLTKGAHDNRYLQAAWNKYGGECWELLLLEWLPPGTPLKEAHHWEQHWIDKLNVATKRYGYNLAPFARGGGVSPSLETRAKMSAAGKGRKMPEWFGAFISRTRKGHPVSQASREKIREKLKGRKLSTAHCAACSKARKGKKQSAAHVAARVASRIASGGNIMTEETKKKLSAVLKGRPLSPEHRAKVVANLRRPEFQAKLRAAQAECKWTTERKQKVSAALLGIKRSAKTRALMSKAAKAKGADPEYRAKISAGVKRQWARAKAQGKKRLPDSPVPLV